MYTAEIYYERDDDNVETDAAKAAIGEPEITVIDTVKYKTFTFRDQSQLILGSNGYVGCQLK